MLKKASGHWHRRRWPLRLQLTGTPVSGRMSHCQAPAESQSGSLETATWLPHGAWPRPQPLTANQRFRFCPAAMSSPWMLAFASPRSRKRLEEPFEDRDPESLPDAGQAGMIGQVFIEGVAEIPAMRQVQAAVAMS